MKAVKHIFLLLFIQIFIFLHFNHKAIAQLRRDAYEVKSIKEFELDSLLEIELEKRVKLTVKILDKHIARNNKAVANNKPEDADYIVDLRRYYTKTVNQFISDEKEKELNLKIYEFHKAYGKATYVLLSPILPEVKVANTRGYYPIFKNEDQLQNDKNQIVAFREKYKKNVNEYNSLAKQGNSGALIYVESLLYLDGASNKWKVKFEDDVLFSKQIERSIQESMRADIALQRSMQGVVFSNYTSVMASSLTKYIEIVHTALKSKLLNIISTSDAEYTEDMMRNLTVKQRLEILVNVRNGIIQDKRFLWGNEAGSIVAKIISTTPKEQHKDMLWGLRNNQLLFNLLPKVYDEMPGSGPNYTEVIFSITNFCYSEPLVPLNKEKVFTEGKAYRWHHSSQGGPFPIINRQDLETERQKDNKIKISIKYSSAQLDLSASNTVPVHSTEMYEWVGLAITSHIDFIKIPSFVQSEGNVIFVPAIFLDWAVKQKFNKDTKDGVVLAINVASFASGVGVLSSSTSLAVKLWAVGDVFFSGASILSGNSGFQRYVVNRYGSGGVDVLNNIQLVGTAFGGAYLTFNGLKAFQNISTNRNILKQMATDAEIAKQYPGPSKNIIEVDEYLKKYNDDLIDLAREVDDVSKLIAKQRQRIIDLKNKYGNLDYKDITFVEGKTVNDITSKMYNEMISDLGSRSHYIMQDKVDKVIEVLASGKTIPQKVSYAQGTELYKVVKKGSTPSPTTEYWLTKAELDNLTSKGSNFESKAALPLGSFADEYDIFKITANQPSVTYRSVIASTVQRGYKTTGGGIQTIVLNRSTWSDPIKYNIHSYIPNF